MSMNYGIKIITIQCAGTSEKSQEISTVYTVSPIQGSQWQNSVVQNASHPPSGRMESGLEPPRCMPSARHTCRESSGLPKIVYRPQWRSHFFWQPFTQYANNSGTNDSLRSFFLVKTTPKGISALWIELWITPKRLTFRSKYVNIMLMI